MKRKKVEMIFGRIAVLVVLSACTAKTALLPNQSGDSPSPKTIVAIDSTPISTSEGSTTLSLQTEIAPATSATFPPQSLSTRVFRPTYSPSVTPGLPVMGIEMYGISPENGLEPVIKSGAFWVRRNALLWSNVEPQQGKRNWGALAGLEDEMKNASRDGLNLILIVRGTPFWAQKIPGVACSAVRPDKLAAFGSFMRDVVARYSSPPYSVKYWEIGNEPDIAPELVSPDSIFGCWGDSKDIYYGGGYYAEMLKVVYPQVKAADPQAQVSIGGLLLDCDPVNPPELPPGSGKLIDCTPSRFLEGILKNGGGDFFDIVSYHAYDYYADMVGAYGGERWHSAWNTTGPVSIAKARYIRSLLMTYGYPDKSLMNTESALLCISKGQQCQSEDFTNTKSYYIAEVYASALAEGLQANLWYSLTGWRDSGLVDDMFQPLPAYDAFRFSASMLQGAVFVSNIDQFPGIKGYEFSRKTQRFWIIWSLDGADHTIRLSETPMAVYDVIGKHLTASRDLNLTVAPLYIEWNP
jgi:hypothetical protein